MNKLFSFIKKAGLKMIAKAKTIWPRIGSKNTAKIATWVSKNKGWLQAVGISSLSASAGAMVSTIVRNYIESKEAVAQRWMDQTGTRTPEAASNAKRVKIISSLRRCIDRMSDLADDDESREEYITNMVKAIEYINFLAVNDSDDDVRRIASRATIVISGCCDVGFVPETGFSSPSMLRIIRNLSEDALTAEDLESSLDSLIDVASQGEPLTQI